MNIITLLSKHRKRTVIVFAILIALTFSVYYFHWFGIGLSEQEKAQRQVAAAVASVGKLMLVPQGTPILATVQDAQTLKTQQRFFANAQNGDQLLIFPESRQAVIYSPSRGLIINAGPVEYPDNSTSKSSTEVTTTATPTVPVSKSAQTVTVEVRNGSGKNGYGASIAKIIRSDPSFSVISVTDAKSVNHTSDLIIDIAKKSEERDAINILANELGATIISNLPKSEAPSKADVVVILGSNITP